MTAETCSISWSVVSSLELLEVEDDSLLELELAGCADGLGVGDVVAADRLVEGPGTGEVGVEGAGGGGEGVARRDAMS